MIDGLDATRLSRIANGTLNAEIERELTWIANNFLDWDAASNMIRIYARAGGLVDAPDEAIAALGARLIERLKGSNPVDGETWVWPVPPKIEAMAAAAFERVRPMSVAALESFLAPLVETSGISPEGDATKPSDGNSAIRSRRRMRIDEIVESLVRQTRSPTATRFGNSAMLATAQPRTKNIPDRLCLRSGHYAALFAERDNPPKT